ncbi:MAG: hypothetical protein MZW92_58665 [Comamonadaceae bacterium]|nr:hypothetical protein [Comamonadaceae bacterium]
MWADTARLVREFRPDVVIASQHLPDGHLGGAPHRPAAPAPGWCTRCTTCGRCSLIELSGMSRRHPFIRAVPGRRGRTPTATPTCVVSMLPKVHAYMASHGLDLAQARTSCPTASRPTSGKPQPPPLRDDVAAAHRRCARAAGRTAWSATPARWACRTRWTRCSTPPGAAARRADRASCWSATATSARAWRGAWRDEGLAHVTLLPPIPKAQIPALAGARSTSPTSAGSGCRSTASASRRTS